MVYPSFVKLLKSLYLSLKEEEEEGYIVLLVHKAWHEKGTQTEEVEETGFSYRLVSVEVSIFDTVL